jgi:hypothetical protein
MTKDRDRADPIPGDEAFRELVVSARVYYRNDKQIDWSEWQHLTNEAGEHGLSEADALRAVRDAVGNGAWSPPLAPAPTSPSGADSLAAVSLRSTDQATTTEARLKKGALINDTYRLEQEVGSGGMGVVWRAVHTKLGTVAAIKFLKGAVGEDSAARFLREARMTAKLESPHLARVYDCAQLQTGELFIVMEYFEGSGLDDVLARDGPLPIKRAVDYMLQACVGLAVAHRREIVHRDIKPANLFLARNDSGEEQIKIVDFGLSRHAQPEDGEGLTRDQTFLGTPDYAPPADERPVVAAKPAQPDRTMLYVLVAAVALIAALYFVLRALRREARQRAVLATRLIRRRPCVPGRVRGPSVVVVNTGSNFFLPCYPGFVMPVSKISIAIDHQQLLLARAAARSEGMSLSAYIARALGTQLEDQQRLDAARALWREWGPESVPTPKEREAFVARMSQTRKRRTRAA